MRFTLNMSADERERLAYLAGQTEIADLYAEAGAAEALADDQAYIRSIIDGVNDNLPSGGEMGHWLDALQAVMVRSRGGVRDELERIAQGLERDMRELRQDMARAEKGIAQALNLIDGIDGA